MSRRGAASRSSALSRGEKTPAREEVPLGFRVDNIRWAADGTLLPRVREVARPSL